LTLLVIAGAGGFLTAQESSTAASAADSEDAPAEAGIEDFSGGAAKPKKPLHWWEWFRGISFGIETGTHEYPLEAWYPNQSTEGYSVRSFYLIPHIAYERLFGDVTLGTEFKAAIDMGAPDPKTGANALNAKDADRKNWYTVYMEEDVDWAISNLFGKEINFPGTLSVFLHNENNVYIAPEFPEIPDERMKGRIVDGSMETGLGKFYMDSDAGWFLGKIGIPVYYLYRFNNHIGSGLNIGFGYKTKFKLGFELTSRSFFVPELKQAETEFKISYDWLDFSAVLDIVAYGPFESALINPELGYHLKGSTFSLGAKISDIGIGTYPALSAYLGLNWKY
jgi:hypothetical protein